MEEPTPFFMEAGSGPGVVCLHSNASTSGQWRKLIELLAPKYHVLAVDSYGAGKSPAWPRDREISLLDEVALIEPVLQRAGDPFTLVAHSYGAAVALLTAVTHPKRVRALALYEPTLFGLLDAEQPSPNEADGIRHTANAAAEAVAAGDLDSAAVLARSSPPTHPDPPASRSHRANRLRPHGASHKPRQSKPAHRALPGSARIRLCLTRTSET